MMDDESERKRRQIESAARAREAQRRKRSARLSAGLCIYCGQEPFRPGKQSCESCSHDLRQRERNYRLRVPEPARTGQECLRCTNHVVDGHLLCSGHEETMAELYGPEWASDPAHLGES